MRSATAHLSFSLKNWLFEVLIIPWLSKKTVSDNCIPEFSENNPPGALHARTSQLQGASRKNVKQLGRFAQEGSNNGALRARMVKFGALRARIWSNKMAFKSLIRAKNGRKIHSLKEERTSAARSSFNEWIFRPFFCAKLPKLDHSCAKRPNWTILARSPNNCGSHDSYDPLDHFFHDCFSFWKSLTALSISGSCCIRLFRGPLLASRISW